MSTITPYIIKINQLTDTQRAVAEHIAQWAETLHYQTLEFALFQRIDIYILESDYTFKAYRTLCPKASLIAICRHDLCEIAIYGYDNPNIVIKYNYPNALERIQETILKCLIPPNSSSPNTSTNG